MTAFQFYEYKFFKNYFTTKIFIINLQNDRNKKKTDFQKNLFLQKIK